MNRSPRRSSEPQRNGKLLTRPGERRRASPIVRGNWTDLEHGESLRKSVERDKGARHWLVA